MEINVLIITLFTVIIECIAVERNFLWNEFQSKKGIESIKDVQQWREKMKKDVLESLKHISPEAKKNFLENANKANNGNWDSLKATDFLQYVKIGNRANFEGRNLQRREKLSNLIVGELISEDGKYMNEIVNGLWLVLEESTWVYPAHLTWQKEGVGLPDPEDVFVDLFSSDSANMVAWIKLLLGDKLAKYAPHDMIIKRIDYELNKRITKPYLENSFWWMGLKDEPHMGNWNIWINSNVLEIAILAIDDNSKRNEVIEKAIKSADKFVNAYPDDGGCDEGPGYWNVAGGCLIGFISTLTEVSNGALSWAKNELFYNIGSYIMKLHIDDKWVVNFGDGSASISVDPPKVYKYGELFNDSKFLEFSALLYSMRGKDKELVRTVTVADLKTFVKVLREHDKMEKINAKAPYLAESWLPNSEVLTMRSKEGSAEGLFFAAKGGNNDENHNHNDVGSFVLFVDGHPGIIDLGVGVYTANTFNSHRYEIWFMQSQWHNLPSINGEMQMNGPQYKANQVLFTKHNDGGDFEMDIAGAYPSQTKVKSWKRKYSFNGKANELQIIESYELSEFKKPFELHFVSALHNITNSEKGKIIFKDNDHNATLLMKYDDQLFDVHIEKKLTEDSHLAWSWRDSVMRVTLKSKLTGTNALKGSFTSLFQKP